MAFCNFLRLKKESQEIRKIVIRKLQIFKNIEKHNTRELHKKGTIFHQAPQITLFLTHPVVL